MKDAVGEALGAASWVWEDEAGTPDSFVRFRQDFEVRNGAVRIALSCDSNYELFVNGERAAFGQYADYPHDKVYDTVEILMENTGRSRTIQLVTTLRQDALKGWISKESPVGRAVMGRKAGDRVYVEMENGRGYYLTIQSITKGSDDGSIPIGSF